MAVPSLPPVMSLPPPPLQMWNSNPYCGVVGLFHLQGSSWDRVRRKFFVHDKEPRALTGQVSGMLP